MATYCLTNVKFDNKYLNACFFSSNSAREGALLPSGYDQIKKNINVNLGNLLNTNIVVNSYNFENYCIIEFNNTKYYYFVTNSNYISVNQWNLSLELDVITQFITGATSTTFEKCLVERAHCNRFVKENNKVKFKIQSDSEIIQNETEIQKINKDRKIVEFEFCPYPAINKWLNDNILCWLYVYVDYKHDFTCRGIAESTITPVPYNKKFTKYKYIVGKTIIENDYSVCCVPVYKNTNFIAFSDKLYKPNNTNTGIIDYEGLRDFYELNDGTQYVYNVKISKQPPFYFGSLNQNNYEIIEGNLIVNFPCETITGGYGGFDLSIFRVDLFGIDSYDRTRYGMFTGLSQTKEYLDSETISTSFEFEFNISDLKGNRNKKFEPKILSHCYEYSIHDSSDGEFTYNPLLLATSNLQFRYTEGLNLTNNNYYYRLIPSGLVPDSSINNWEGVVNTVDYSQTVANDNIDNFIANNKNFLLTKGVGMVTPVVTSLATGGVGGAVAGIGYDVFNTTVNYLNLKNKINSLRNTNDSVDLNLLVNTGIQLYVDINKSYDVDIDNFYNFLYNFGYKINKVCNPYDYINTRKYFNYIKCNLEFININVPLHIEDKIKNIFSEGIRLWNSYDNIYNYSKENYEVYLDDNI